MAKPELKLEMDAFADRFILILNRDFRDDETCRHIGADRETAVSVGKMMWSYVEKEFTRELNEERRARVGTYWASVVTAIAGLEAAAALKKARDPQRAAKWLEDAQEFRSEQQGAEKLLDTKRHGRERDHGILYSIRQTLEAHLGPISNKTLANLVNAGLQAAGQDEADNPVTEDDVRMTLKNFLDRNPDWDATANKAPQK